MYLHSACAHHKVDGYQETVRTQAQTYQRQKTEPAFTGSVLTQVLNLFRNFLLRQRQELLHAHRARVLAAAPSQGHLPGFHLAVANHQHVRDLFLLRVPDLGIHPVRPRVHAHPQSGFLILRRYRVRERHMPVGNRDDDRLFGRQPGWESPGVMLDQHSKEAFHRAQQRAVDHVRAVRLPVLADIFQPKAFRLVKVELDGGELPLAPERVVDLQVNLRPVERAAAVIHLVGQARALKGRFQGIFRIFPLRGVAYAFFGLRAQEGMKLAETERAQDVQAEVQHKVNLLRHLVRAAEVVRVILREAAHAHKPVQHARAFVAIDGALLRVAQRQVAVRAQAALVDVQVEGAVHRLDEVLLTLNFDGRVHVLFVEAQMSARLPKRRLADMRGVDEVIAVGHVLVFPEALNLEPDHAAVGVPKDQPLPNLIVLAVQVQLLAQLAVVALAGFFHLPQVFFQLFLAFPGGAVDALQHGAFLVSTPIRSSHVQQLNRFRIDFSRAANVWTAAKIREAPGLVDRDRHNLIAGVAVIIQPAVLQPVNQFQLEGLVGEKLTRFRSGNFLAAELLLLGDELLHALLNFRQVLGGEAARQVKIVVKAVLNRGADGDPPGGELLQDGFGHDVRRAVADAVELRLLVFFIFPGHFFLLAAAVWELRSRIVKQKRPCALGREVSHAVPPRLPQDGASRFADNGAAVRLSASFRFRLMLAGGFGLACSGAFTPGGASLRVGHKLLVPRHCVLTLIYRFSGNLASGTGMFAILFRIFPLPYISINQHALRYWTKFNI